MTKTGSRLLAGVGISVLALAWWTMAAMGQTATCPMGDQPNGEHWTGAFDNLGTGTTWTAPDQSDTSYVAFCVSAGGEVEVTRLNPPQESPVMTSPNGEPIDFVTFLKTDGVPPTTTTTTIETTTTTTEATTTTTEGTTTTAPTSTTSPGASTTAPGTRPGESRTELPNTGADTGLVLLGLTGVVALVAGVYLVLRAARREWT